MEVGNSLVIYAICRATPYKVPQTGPEVANSLGDLSIICMARRVPKLPQSEVEVFNSICDLCVICMAPGLPKLPQPGPEVVNGPNDLYAICITQNTTDHSLAP